MGTFVEVQTIESIEELIRYHEWRSGQIDSSSPSGRMEFEQNSETLALLLGEYQKRYAEVSHGS